MTQHHYPVEYKIGKKGIGFMKRRKFAAKRCAWKKCFNATCRWEQYIILAHDAAGKFGLHLSCGILLWQ